MKLSIRNVPGKPLDVALISHIERRAELALAGARPYVRQVRIGLLEVRGPKASLDKRCQVQLLFGDETPLTVTETSSNEIEAVDRALFVAERLAVRRIEHRGRQSLLHGTNSPL